MAKGRITLASVKAAKPKATGQDHLWDDEVGGFVMIVNPGGTKTFALRYQIGGRKGPERFYKIGRFPALHPQEARAEARRLKALVERGVDIQAEKVRRRDEAQSLAFEAIAGTFIDSYLKQNWKSWKDAGRRIERQAVPAFRGRSVRDVGRADIAKLLDTLSDVRGARSNLFRVLRVLFGWCVDRGYVELSPMHGMKAPPPPAPRDRVLKPEEITHLWAATDEAGYAFGHWLQLLMLTSSRRTECAKLRWEELDRQAALWTLPRDRTKNALVTDIPLSEAAICVLDEVARLQLGKRVEGGNSVRWPTSGYVFTHNGTTPISGFSKAKLRLDKAMLERMRKTTVEAGDDPSACRLEEWNYHDLRRTCATYLQEMGYPLEVSEAVLNHASGSRAGLRAVYNRHDYKAEKRKALSELGQRLTALRPPAEDHIAAIPQAA